MSSIPDEVYLEVLLRVPVRTTYICKCVCKTWLGLISNPTFIKMHLNLTLHKNNPNLMLRSYDDVSDHYLIHAISHDSLTSFDGNEYDGDDAVEMDYSFKSSDFFAELICSCNGLVALSYVTYPDDKEFLCLWNPSTHEYKVLPESPNEFPMEDCGMLAIGYDYKIYDYKLVKVHQDKGKDGLVDIYTLGTNSWKSIESIPYNFPNNLATNVLVNEILHWLGYPCGKDISKGVIVSLNISDERFKVIQLPNEPRDSKQLFTNVGVLEGSLCVLLSVPQVCYDIWVMQEYGVRESWTKCYVITHERILEHEHFLNLLRSFKNGEILFFIPGDLVLYNPKCASAREPNIGIETQLYVNVNYFESLVPLNSGTYARGLKEEENEQVEENEEEEEVE